MKSNLLKLSVCMFLAIFLAGCEKTYLSCSKTLTDNDAFKVNQTIKLGYKSKELVNSNVYYDYKFKNGNQADIESMKKELNAECDKYEDVKGATCTVSSIEDGLHFELSLDVGKISEEDSIKFEEMLSYGSYTDTKNELGKEYTCK